MPSWMQYPGGSRQAGASPWASEFLAVISLFTGESALDAA